MTPLNQANPVAPIVEANPEFCCSTLIKKVITAVCDFFTWIVVKIYEGVTWLIHCCSSEDVTPIADTTPAPPQVVVEGMAPTEAELQAIVDAAEAKKLQEQEDARGAAQPTRIPGRVIIPMVDDDSDEEDNNFGLIGAIGRIFLGGGHREPAPVAPAPTEPTRTTTAPLKAAPLITAPKISAAEMKKRKQDALNELKAGKQNVELNATVLEFDLDAALDKYCKDHSTYKLLELFDYANPGKQFTFGDTRETFETKIVKEFPSGDKKEIPQYKNVREALSRLSSLLEGKMNRVKKDPAQQEALKQQIRNIIKRLLDASEDCVDQVLAQLEHILIESLASESTTGEATPEAQLQMRTAALLYQYKSNLITSTVQNLFPQSKHQADIERAVKQVVGPFIGMQAKINALGAQFDTEHFIPDKEKTIDTARAAVLRRYNNDVSFIPMIEKDLWNEVDERPLSYLTRGAIAPELHNPVDGLRTALVQWAGKHFDLDAEDDLTAELLTALSGEMEVTMGGNFSESGLGLILLSSGIIQKVKQG